MVARSIPVVHLLLGLSARLQFLTRCGLLNKNFRLAPLHADGETLVIASIRDVSDAQRVQAMAEAATQQLERLQALTDTALAHLELDDLL